MRAFGIDISGWQKRIDWDQVPASVRFVYVKSTDGRSSANRLRFEQLAAVSRTGRLGGSYHYAQLERAPGETVAFDAREEAKRLCEVYRAPYAANELPPCLDLEDLEGHSATPDEVVDFTTNFLDQVKIETGRTGLLYTGKAFVARFKPAFVRRASELTGFRLWIPQYPGRPVNRDVDKPPVVEPWGEEDWAFWQFAGDPVTVKWGNVPKCPGVEGWCDLNVFNGDEAALRRFCGFVD